MAVRRRVFVHLLPSLIPAGALQGGVAVVIDVLRATTTIIQALASGCSSVLPVAEVEEARALAERLRPQKVLLGGERDGRAIAGFDLGNSPSEYTPAVCKGAVLVFTTTNGTRALLKTAEAERVLLAGFVNFSSVSDQLLKEQRPIHLVCAGTREQVTLEDALLAGAFVDVLSGTQGLAGSSGRRNKQGKATAPSVQLDDGARLAWDCFEHHGRVLLEALHLSQGGQHLVKLGLESDIAAASQVDRLMLVPELQRQPLCVHATSFGMIRSLWPG